MVFSIWGIGFRARRVWGIGFRAKFCSQNTPNEGDPRIGKGPSQKCDFLVLKSTVLGGFSLSGFLTKTELHRLQDFKFFTFCQGFSKFFSFF